MQPIMTSLSYVGRLSWEKNLRCKPPFSYSGSSMKMETVIVEAFNGLEQSLRASGTFPSSSVCRLIIVGEGPARDDIEKLCQEYRVGVTFMGYQGGEMLAKCFASCDVFAFPSVTEVSTFSTPIVSSLNRLSDIWQRCPRGSGFRSPCSRCSSRRRL